MDNKNGSGARAGSLEGKGFYIVLFLCEAVIGVSAWILFTDLGTNVENTETAEVVEVDVIGDAVTVIPAEPDTEKEEAEEMADTMEVTEGEQADANVDEGLTQTVLSDATTTYIWPVEGNIEVPYSIETLLYDSTMADWRTHDGIDLSSEVGTPVLAVATGLVIDVHNDDLLGTMVEIDHQNGMHSVYANLAAQPPVAPGDMVVMGQIVGSVGNTALSEVNQVSHLHFSMKQDGLSADPTLYLPSEWRE